MQPSSREMQGMAASMNGISGDVSGAGQDDFLDQMLSGLSSPWGDLGNPKSPWELSSANPNGSSAAAAAAGDESSLLASRLRQHEIGGGGSPPGSKPMVLQLNNLHLNPQMLLPVMGPSPTAGGGESGLLPLPLTLGSGGSGDVEAAFKSPNSAGGEELYNGFGGPLQHQHFNHTQQGSSIAAAQGYGGAAPTAGGGAAQTPTGAASGGGAGPPRQRVRARRGQATDPHSIAERLRRERIAERMKALQELVPNANKTDKASMLDEIIDYVKFLQLQVKVLSMSRLGGAAAVAPLVANNMSSEGGGSNGNGGAATNDSLTVTEHQVAKLMEEDMGSAMQYLQGKGLCLMPISLASAISSATCHPRASSSAAAGTHQAPPSPSVSVLTVQSAVASGDADDGKGK